MTLFSVTILLGILDDKPLEVNTNRVVNAEGASNYGIQSCVNKSTSIHGMGGGRGGNLFFLHLTAKKILPLIFFSIDNLSHLESTTLRIILFLGKLSV